MNYETRAVAARLIQKIEGFIDPFDVATGNTSVLTEEIQQMIIALGGNRDVRDFKPGGVAIYLLALLIANS